MSQVEIANDALTLLGKRRITALTEDSDEARVMTQFMQSSIDYVLQMYPWRCAMYQASLSQLSSAPSFGFDYAYQLPTDPYCLRVWRVNDQDDENKWKKYQRKLFWDGSTCKIDYVGRTDVSDLDEPVRVAIGEYLAYRAAYALTQSRSMRNDALQIFQASLTEARVIDSLQGSSRVLKANQLDRVRINSKGISTSTS